MNHTKMQAAVQAYIDLFNAKDAEGIADLYADNATVEDPYGTQPKKGRAEILEFYSGAVKSGSTLVRTGPTQIASNVAAFAFTVYIGGLDEESKGVDIDMPMGKMEIDVIDTFQFNEGDKVTAMKAYWDPAVNLRQT
ncbi:MAG: SnoaL-like domain-containing protein [Hellea sp.]|nr:SnoaL-like domain-containing protein [Hellea sp.]